MTGGTAETARPPTGEALLSVRNLRTEIETEDGTLVAVDDISFDLFAGEVLAVVGESGCGKTMLALSILGLLPGPGASTTAGEVRLAGEDLLTASPQRRRQARGAEIAMIFQDPLTALNPVHRVGDQIAEMLRAHRPLRKRYARLRAEDLLKRVGIPDADRRARCYPHELSGGMRQRVMIAMAVALDPVVLIADEPTTALDATVQAQVLEVLSEVRQRMSGAMMIITHDLGVVAGAADRVMVMYAGHCVERGDVRDVYERASHPYTAGLLAAVPRLDRTAARLTPIAGSPPVPIGAGAGCSFAPRCPMATDICEQQRPDLRGRTNRPAEAASMEPAVACHHAVIEGPTVSSSH
ncbi:MAG: ABC transporter ATP-binding protein [Acidimicrobiaceae bacterium]|nr:ABC transporter ATP-binding protein [Acidimicrobiaceae bacterium]MYE55802.1 ABC transporter ATP-binding protein [Acidimicrobiaceae bacterium]